MRFFKVIWDQWGNLTVLKVAARVLSFHSYETRAKLDINTPQTSSHKFGTNSLRYQGSTLYNELPDIIKGNKMTKATCGDIKKYLLSEFVGIESSK
jgi:hypothetical protein